MYLYLFYVYVCSVDLINELTQQQNSSFIYLLLNFIFMKTTNNKAQSAKKTVNKTEAKKVSAYELNVLKTNQNYKEYKGSLGFIRSALLEMHTNFKKLDVKFIDYLNSTKKDQKKYEELKKATRFNDNGQTCVFYVLQALNKLTK